MKKVQESGVYLKVGETFSDIGESIEEFKKTIQKVRFKETIVVVGLNRSYIQQIRKQSENDYIPQKPENLRFAPIIFFYFAFLIDIIDNII